MNDNNNENDLDKTLVISSYKFTKEESVDEVIDFLQDWTSS